jgi:AraC-like DNA-binding protein
MITTSRVDSALGCWTLTQWQPESDTRLAQAVLRIWLFEGSTVNPRERVFPDGSLEIVVQLNASYHRADSPSQPFPPVSVGGVRTTALTIEGPGHPVRVLGIRLAPSAAFSILGTSLDALTDCSYDLHDIIGMAAAELGERCHGALDGPACVREALRWVKRRLERGSEPDPVVSSFAARIEGGGGALAIDGIEAASRRSRSRFAARFRAQIGVAPKHFARIVRFRQALQFLLTRNAALGDVAARAGYYDQAHMNAEFHSFAGLTPRGFRDAAHYPDSLSLAECEPQPGSKFQDAAAAL